MLSIKAVSKNKIQNIIITRKQATNSSNKIANEGIVYYKYIKFLKPNY